MRLVQKSFIKFWIVFLWFGFTISASVAKEFLQPEQAFIVEATWLPNSQEISIDYRPVQGYYIYQESLQYRVFINGQKIALKSPRIPKGVEKFDDTFGKKWRFFRNPLKCYCNFQQILKMAFD